MRRLARCLVVLLLLSQGCSTAPISGFKLPDYQEKRLANQLPVIFIKDDSLPYLSLILLVKSGSGVDPIGKTGLGYMVGSLLDKGTQARGAQALAEDVESMGADFSVSVEKDYTLISMRGLSFHQERLISDFSEILTSPAFQDGEIRRQRQNTLAMLKKEVDNPSAFASSNFNASVFGTHPYARRDQGNPRDVARLNRKDIIKHYFQYYRPNNALLAVVGRMDKSISAQLEANLGKWEPRDQKELVFPDIPSIQGLQIELIDKADLEQTQIRIGHPGIRRNNPDFLKLKVANSILGEGMGSRLFKEIRENRGLTYGIYSYFVARRDSGPFMITTFSRNEKVGETIRESLNVVTEFQKGVKEKEVEEAKAYLQGTFPQILETPESLAQNLLILRYHGLPDSYLRDYISNIEKITVEDVNRVAQKYFDPKNVKVLVFGRKDQVIQQLQPLGVVKTKNYKELL